MHISFIRFFIRKIYFLCGKDKILGLHWPLSEMQEIIKMQINCQIFLQ